MKPLLAILCASLLNAATVTVCSSGCTTTSLQSALDTLAACGDTITIRSTEMQIGTFLLHYRNCDSNPITVTSDRAAMWLPSANQRATPSQLANMAQIVTNTTNPALQGVLDGSNRAPAGWKFIAIAFKSTAVTFDLVGFNVNGEAANSSQIADNITFDRCYFFMPSSGNYQNLSIQDMIRGDVTNLTIKNSFFGDGFFNGYIESHGPRMITTAGPVTLTNNFITTSSAPIFTGGGVPSYPTYLENGLTAQYNYFWRPWKYNGDPAQPFAADYVSWAQSTPRTGPYSITAISNTGLVTVSTSTGALISASLMNISGVGGCTVANANNWRISGIAGNQFQLLNFPGCNSAYTSGGTVNEFAATVCTKNLGELKWGTGITWQYNVGENSWQPNQCQSQYNGFTDTLRVERDNPGVIFSLTDATHITWTGSYRIGVVPPDTSTNTQDLGICISLPTTGTECHAVSSFSGASLVSSTAFSAAPAGAFLGWISYTASAKLENLTFAHNVFKNVDQSFTVLGVGFGNGVGDAGYGKNHNVSQNLWYQNSNYIQGYNGFGLSSGEQADFNAGFVPTNFTFDHNTVYFPNGIAHGAFVYFSAIGCGLCSTAIQPKFTGSAITNNLFGASAAGGNGPFSGDATGNTIDSTNAYMLTSNVKNNAIPGGSQSGSATGGNTVSGNIYSAWSDPFGGLAPSGIFTVLPASPYYNAGTDGASLGANFTQLPLITNLTVTPASTTASLTFTVAAGINDLKNTQVCELEVSTNRNLQSDLGTYSVITSLDPTVTPGADLSTQSGVTLSGNNVTWAITGLVNATLYYGRLQCYGDTEWFTFTTGSAPGPTCSPKTHITPPNVTDVQLQTNMALGVTACSNSLTGSGCTVVDVQRIVNAALGGACVVGP